MTRRDIVCVVVLLWIHATIPAVNAAIPEPDAVLYGSGTSPLIPGDVVDAKFGSDVVASFVVGSLPGTDALYVLRIGLEGSVGGGAPGGSMVLHVGDQVRLFLNGADTNLSRVISMRGMIQRVDLPVDPDRDGDGIPSSTDNCPLVANASQTDSDQDGAGDACDACTDADMDGFGDPVTSVNTCAPDSCPGKWNPSQRDSDSDGIGDACETPPTLWVSSDPDDHADYLTVATGLAAAQADDTTVRILAGLGPYNEGVVLNSGRAVRLVGVAGDRAVISGTGSGPTIDVVSTSSRPVVVQDLTIYGEDGLRAGASTEIRDCAFASIVGTAVDLRSGSHRVADVTVTSAETGVQLASGTTAVIERSVFQDLVNALDVNGTVDLQSSLLANSLTGVVVHPTGILRMVYSTVGGSGVAGVDNQGQVSVDYSVLWNNATDLVGVACTSVRVSDTSSPNCSSTNGNYSVDPRLRTDHHLAPDSPFIDLVAPTSFSGIPCLDLSGGPRLRDFNHDGIAKSDLGAYEEAPASSVASVAHLRWTNRTTLTWDVDPTAAEYHPYRGNLASLGYTTLGECRDPYDPNRTDNQFVDTEVPVRGQGYFYLMTLESTAGVEGSSGDGSCAERTRSQSCSTFEGTSAPPIDATDPGEHPGLAIPPPDPTELEVGPEDSSEQQ